MRLAAISIDLDEIHHYYAIHGLEGRGRTTDLVYDRAVPRASDWASALGVPLTFFVVGSDLARSENVETVRALDGPAGESWGRRYRFVLVDEYQDTNRAQLELLRRLCREHANVTAVGDDDQSIYGWRGAEAANILAFEAQFPGARIVKLEQNYRSTPTILSAANAVIKNNVARHAKQLWSEKRAGDKLVLAVAPDADGEATFVCDEIERLRLEDRRRLVDMAILYRANVQARVYEEMLLARRISHVMHGGQQFYERKEVKDLIAYLKLVLNPGDLLKYRLNFHLPAAELDSILLSTPVVDDVSIYYTTGTKFLYYELCGGEW